jgi:hypothetical protein
MQFLTKITSNIDLNIAFKQERKKLDSEQPSEGNQEPTPNRGFIYSTAVERCSSNQTPSGSSYSVRVPENWE